MKQAEYYGIELIMDLAECNPRTIRSRKKIKEYVDQLCQLIQMKPYGKPIIKRFGFNNIKTIGYSAVQLIETSSIIAHFSETLNTAYINIFSCKLFKTKEAKTFTKQFFNAKIIKSKIIKRS